MLTEQTKLNLPEAYRELILQQTPSWRNGEPADLGATAAFLLSDLSAWTTGQVFNVDGGTTMRA